MLPIGHNADKKKKDGGYVTVPHGSSRAPAANTTQKA